MNTIDTYKRAKQTYVTLLVIAIAMVVSFFSAYLFDEIYEGEQHIHSASSADHLKVIPYSHVFVEEAPTIGWPWERLAAMAWTESHFNPHAQSIVGAKGIMQLMPKTAEYLGLNDSTIWVPEDNIRAGVRLVALLQKRYTSVPDENQRWRFVVAAYNSGSGVVNNAMHQAADSGLSPYIWANVEPFIPYAETRCHVRKVEEIYNELTK